MGLGLHSPPVRAILFFDENFRFAYATSPNPILDIFGEGLAHHFEKPGTHKNARWDALRDTDPQRNAGPHADKHPSVPFAEGFT